MSHSTIKYMTRYVISTILCNSIYIILHQSIEVKLKNIHNWMRFIGTGWNFQYIRLIKIKFKDILHKWTSFHEANHLSRLLSLYISKLIYIKLENFWIKFWHVLTILIDGFQKNSFNSFTMLRNSSLLSNDVIGSFVWPW